MDKQEDGRDKQSRAKMDTSKLKREQHLDTDEVKMQLSILVNA
jgi:hypothetical protein